MLFFFFHRRYANSAELLLCTILRQKRSEQWSPWLILHAYFPLSGYKKNVYFSNNKTNTELIFSSRGALRLTVA